MPGFQVLVELGNFLLFVRIEAQRFYRPEGFRRKDIPDIFGNDVGNQEINFIRSIRIAAVSATTDVISERFKWNI
jgi:hypothetical protein